MKLGIKAFIDGVVNHIWFVCHFKRYARFKKEVIQKGYNLEDIWWHRGIGFICMPPINCDCLTDSKAWWLKKDWRYHYGTVKHSSKIREDK